VYVDELARCLEDGQEIDLPRRERGEKLRQPHITASAPGRRLSAAASPG
jgi:hypothetical protein